MRKLAMAGILLAWLLGCKDGEPPPEPRAPSAGSGVDTPSPPESEPPSAPHAVLPAAERPEPPRTLALGGDAEGLLVLDLESGDLTRHAVGDVRPRRLPLRGVPPSAHGPAMSST